MTERRHASAALATIAVAVVGFALLASAPTAVADPHGNGSSAYAISQGEQCIDVTPIVDKSQSVEAFYDYRWNGSGQDYSSYGTKPYQENDTSTLLLYQGSEGTSLVVVHDRHHQPAESGTLGGFATFSLSGLPAAGEWVVTDDDYVGQDDEFADDGRTMIWGWSQGRTDGGAFRGLTGETEITIDPTFNDSSEHSVNPENSPSYDGLIHDWDVVTGQTDGTDRVRLDSLGEPVTIEGGYCTPPNASLTVSNATPTAGQIVTLDASNATSSAAVTEYRWDTDGDGTTDATTTSPTLDYEFQHAGERTVTVTVDDGYESGAASAVVNVTDETPPTAQVSTNGTAAATEPLAFSANGSQDAGAIVSYEWQFGDGETVSGPDRANVSHTYATAGEYEVQLTVTDSGGNVDSTNVTVTVTEPPDPVASLPAPDAATVGETIALDAGGSDTGPNASYSWSIDGNATNASGATFQHAFSTSGEHTVSVNVSDDYGWDVNQTTIEVFAPATAEIRANRTAVETGEAIAFEAGGPTANVVDYTWTFGDVTDPAGNQTVTHGYDEAGNYTVTLTVTDSAGNANTTTEIVHVEPSSEPAGPTAVLDAPGSATVNETVTFDAGDSAGTITSYQWTFGDGETASGESPTVQHVYQESGNYTVELTVVGANGTNATTTTLTVAAEEDDGDSENGDGGQDGGDGDGGDGSGSDESDSGDAGSGSSGSGGYAPPAQPEPDPIETSVERANGTIVVTVEHARADEAVSVDVPAGANAEAAGGNRAVELRSLAIRPAHDADAMTVRFEPADRAVPGRFTRPAAYVPDATVELADVGYEFAIDPNATGAAGVSTENLTAYAGGAEWTPVETTVDAGTNGSPIVASATADGGSPVGLGSQGAALLVTDVRTVGVAANGTVRLAVTASNTGSAAGAWTVPIAAAGGIVGEQSVALDPGEENVLEATVAVDALTDLAGETGGASVTIAGARRNLALLSVSALELSSSAPAPNESVTISATVQNRGSEVGEFDATLRLDGEPVASESVVLEPGQRTTVSFERQFASGGRYELAIGNATASVDVEARDSFDGGEESQSGATSGFGALAALLATAVVILAALVGSGRLGKRP
ncbi:hypothetical protein GCM10028857_25450 [Salinarchaeum chitinilyticum]